MMTLYSIALFLHVVGALGLFVAFGIEGIGLAALGRASTLEQARMALGILARTRVLGPLSLGAILVFGFVLMGSWGPVGWILVALASLVLIAIIGAALTGMRMVPLGRAIALDNGTLTPDLLQRLQDPMLRTSLRLRVAIALGVVFLMTAKPDLTGALLSIGIAIVLGLIPSLPIGSRTQTKGKPAITQS
jgi:hypothetical protein